VEWLSDPQIWAGLLTLTALEIVLGIDNLVFITILAGRLPAERQNRARQVGLALALVSRLGAARLNCPGRRTDPADL
jgi:predicted tellurium resistance membrane protein TerC